MTIICTYDVKEKRCPKYMKILRKYLFHVQKSVFEGNLTPKQFRCLKEELNRIKAEDDSVIFYISYNEKQIYKYDLDGDLITDLNVIKE